MSDGQNNGSGLPAGGNNNHRTGCACRTCAGPAFRSYGQDFINLPTRPRFETWHPDIIAEREAAGLPVLRLSSGYGWGV